MQVTPETLEAVAGVIWQGIFSTTTPFADAGPDTRRECFISAEKILEALKPTGETSDGFHTFNELYRYRMLYNAALFNAWVFAPDVLRFDVHKSRLHSDGQWIFPDPETGLSDWFIVVAQLPTGQISNHYRISEAWDLFKIPQTVTAAEWDGHTPAEAADRLERFLRGER